VEEVFEEFAVAADDEGLLDREAFNGCFNSIIQRNGGHTSADSARTAQVLTSLFDVFDQDGNEAVDFSELASGLSVLCGGTRDEKAEAAFALYDYNGDGFITLDEMTRYLTSVFKVMYETQPGTQERMGVSAEDLAEVTAEQAFTDADLNHDGRLSFEEFQRWYSDANGSEKQGQEEEVEEAAFGSDESDEDGFETDAAATIDGISLREVRRVTSLESLSVEEVFEEFAVAADEDGLLDESSFFNCFKQIKLRNGGIDEQDYGIFNSIVLRLFEIFDTDGNNAVDFSELASGLSVLCGGSRDEKAEAAFALYDYNNDGFISLVEMTRYLASVFKVMYETQPGTKERMGVSAEKLAEVTAEQAFTDADLNHDGRLSFEEFRLWYSGNNGSSAGGDVGGGSRSEAPTVAVQPDERPTLQEVRELLGLGSYSVEEVFSSFADASDAEGSLDQEAFTRVFENFASSGFDAGADIGNISERVLSITQALFGIFVDSQGKVDFCDLASGLSILCGGSAGNRIAAAFSLYDYNGDGFISLPEMTRFLTCVFKVLFEVRCSADGLLFSRPLLAAFRSVLLLFLLETQPR
jgi:Ca2+-binding EF-hand superfamily protein